MRLSGFCSLQHDTGIYWKLLWNFIPPKIKLPVTAEEDAGSVENAIRQNFK
ncbi:MAG: hypothetical protein H6696_02060 [Deferribacteres bacterium]|nr:hypothetical protein [Deferribacteres bacterium]